MSNEYNCYDCGDKADYIDIPTSLMHCVGCIREMYPPKGEGEDE
jgi:hypothetical protein